MKYSKAKFSEVQEVLSQIDPVFMYSDLHIARRFGGMDYLPVVRDFFSKIEQFKGPHLFLGDLFHNSRPTPSEIRLLLDVLETTPKTYLLEGNHTVASTAEPTIVEALENVIQARHVVVSEPRAVQLDIPKIGGGHESVNFIFIPYSKEIDEEGHIEGIIKEHYVRECRNVGLIHCALAGSKSGTGHPLVNVGQPVNDSRLRGLDALFAGDFHRHQLLNEDGNVCVMYVGAPSQMTFGDNFDPQVGILYVEDGELVYKSFNPAEMGYSPLSFYTVEAHTDHPKHAYHRRIEDDLSDLYNKPYISVRVVYDKGNVGARKAYLDLKANLHETSRVFDHGYNDNVEVAHESVDFGQVNTPDTWKAGFKSYVKQSLFNENDNHDYYFNIIDAAFAN